MKLLPFKPSFWPTLFTIPSILVMLGLSVWQLERLQWKNELIAGRSARLTASPVNFADIGGDLASFEYRRIRIIGQFLHDKELYLAARSRDGVPGYQIVTPFQTGGGQTLLVNRGFVPLDRKDPGSRAAGQLEGQQSLEAILRLPRPRAWMQPENEPGKNVWFYIDLPAMSRAAGVSNFIADFYLDAEEDALPGGWPRGGQTRISLPNDHLQYAITWALLALALAVIYVVYHMPRKERKK